MTDREVLYQFLLYSYYETIWLEQHYPIYMFFNSMDMSVLNDILGGT